MKIKLSKSQWEQIGKTAGWSKKAQQNPLGHDEAIEISNLGNMLDHKLLELDDFDLDDNTNSRIIRELHEIFSKLEEKLEILKGKLKSEYGITIDIVRALNPKLNIVSSPLANPIAEKTIAIKKTSSEQPGSICGECSGCGATLKNNQEKCPKCRKSNPKY